MYGDTAILHGNDAAMTAWTDFLDRGNLDIFGFTLTDAEMAARAGLDQGEDAAVDSDLRVEY
jgi:hypothetical protein